MADPPPVRAGALPAALAIRPADARAAVRATDRSAHLDVRGAATPALDGPADASLRCRQILADLLCAAWPDEADRHAEALIGEFGSLSGLLATDPCAIARCLRDGGEGVAAFLGTVRGAQLHMLRREIEDGPLLPTSAALLDYLHVGMAWTADEQFRILYLNSRNRLLRDEIVATGTPNEVTVHPRAIVKRALELSATALILVHNHPSGSSDPSQSDIQTTARIVRAAKTLDIVVHDHIIVARSGWRSFRQSGLLV